MVGGVVEDLGRVAAGDDPARAPPRAEIARNIDELDQLIDEILMASRLDLRDASEASALGQVVREQTEAARRQVDWHLQRARAAGAPQLYLAVLEANPGATAPVEAIRKPNQRMAWRALRCQRRSSPTAATARRPLTWMHDRLSGKAHPPFALPEGEKATSSRLAPTKSARQGEHFTPLRVTGSG